MLPPRKKTASVTLIGPMDVFPPTLLTRQKVSLVESLGLSIRFYFKSLEFEI